MMAPKLELTPAARKFIRRMVRFSDHPAGGFRLTVSPGGCSGYASEFTVEAAPRDGDLALVMEDVTLFLPAQSRLILDGVTVDFAETATSAGLTIVNPNAAACGCSTSSDATVPAQATVSVSSIVRHRPAAVRS